MLKFKKSLVVLLCCMVSGIASADVVIPMYLTAQHGTSKAMGSVTVQDTKYGLLLMPDLTGLTPGLHGFHVHVNPSCDDNGMAAGGHLDPSNTGKHLGPYNDMGHLGDLPALYVDKDGKANLPVLAPRLKVSDIQGHSLMIHAGGDNYSDTPEKLGGGAARMVCGVIK
jgi:superoxide dismutase, Cu-Zn family